MFCFCRIFITSWPKDLFLSKKGQFLIKFRSKFNWYSMRFFQKALVGFNNLWIHFILREFNFVSEIPILIIQMEIWAKYLGSRIFWFTIIFLPLSSRYGFFAIPSFILYHMELSRIELPKLTSITLMKILQRLDFLKFLSLSWMHLHIVLKSLVSCQGR